MLHRSLVLVLAALVTAATAVDHEFVAPPKRQKLHPQPWSQAEKDEELTTPQLRKKTDFRDAMVQKKLSEVKSSGNEMKEEMIQKTVGKAEPLWKKMFNKQVAQGHRDLLFYDCGGAGCNYSCCDKEDCSDPAWYCYFDELTKEDCWEYGLHALSLSDDGTCYPHDHPYQCCFGPPGDPCRHCPPRPAFQAHDTYECHHYGDNALEVDTGKCLRNELPYQCCEPGSGCDPDYCPFHVDTAEECYVYGMDAQLKPSRPGGKFGRCQPHSRSDYQHACCETDNCRFRRCHYFQTSAQECFDAGHSYAYDLDSDVCEESNYPIACCFYEAPRCGVDNRCPTRAVSGYPFECYWVDNLPFYTDASLPRRKRTCEIVDPVNFNPYNVFDCCYSDGCEKYSCFFYGVDLKACGDMGFPYGKQVDPPPGPPPITRKLLQAGAHDRELLKADPKMKTWGNCMRTHYVGIEKDPHLTSWNGTMFDWHGQCDVLMLRAPHFHQAGDAEQDDVALDIHVRTTIRYDYSYIETAIIKIGEDVFEVGSFGDYYLNGVNSAQLPATVGGFKVTHTQETKKTHLFKIMISENEHLSIDTFKDIVSVNVEHASTTRFKKSVGMLGEFGGQGRLLARDGETTIDDPNVLAQEWQIKPEDGLFFQSVREPQYPQECRLPDVTASERRLGQGAVSEEEAKAACAKLTSPRKDACILDVLATGDVDIAETY